MKQARSRARFGFIISLVTSLFVCGFASIPQAQAETVTQTRYLLNMDFLMNNYGSGGELFGLGNATEAWGNGTIQYAITRHKTGVGFGFKVYAYYLDADSSVFVEEITPTVNQFAERLAEGEGYQSGTWTATEFNLSRYYCLAVKFYTRWRTVTTWGAWYPMFDALGGIKQDFITESLGMDKMLSSEWNVTAYTKWYDNGVTQEIGQIYFGNSTYNSRIENMQFDNGIITEENMEQYFLLGLTFTTIPLALFLSYTKRKKHETPPN